MDRKAHWEAVYAAKAPGEMSWYQPLPTRSLELLQGAGIGPRTTIIDIGGGDSLLVDALVERGLGHVTVLDISRGALTRAQARLGARAAQVSWIEADVTHATLPMRAFDVWHDRAVFHFLTSAEDRRRYVEAATTAVRPGGTVVMGTFAPEGPDRCSGLEVARYDAEGLARALGAAFALRHGQTETHRTPTGAEQYFTWTVLERVAD